jgi:hypothetical protein
MTDENPVAAALALLGQKRATLADELRQVDEAIASLEKLVGKKPRAKTTDRSGPSVRTKLVTLLEEEPRDWSAGEILQEYKRRGDPIQGADPSNALRAAFADAKKKGMIYSTSVGRYMASTWIGTGEFPDDAGDSSAASQPNGERNEVMP